MSGEPPDDAGLYRSVRWVLLGGMAMGFLLMTVGFVLAFATGSETASRALALAEVLPAALRKDPGGILDLGILTLFATPVLYLLIALGSFMVRRDWLYAACAAIVVAILAASL